MSANTSVPPQISDTIIAIIIYFTATSLFIENLIKKLRSKNARSKELKAEEANKILPEKEPPDVPGTKSGGDEQ